MLTAETKAAIGTMMGLLSTSYPGRVTVTDQMIQVWGKLLTDLEPALIVAATEDLCSRLKWPPSIAEVREEALRLSRGTLTPIGPMEAWERVSALSRGEDVKLTKLEKRALKVIGDMYDLKTSTASGLQRRDFVKAYDEFMAKEVRKANALPDVKRLAESARPALPPVPHDLKPVIDRDLADMKQFKSTLPDAVPAAMDQNLTGDAKKSEVGRLISEGYNGWDR